MAFTKEEYIGIALAVVGIVGVIGIIMYEAIRNSSFGLYSLGAIAGSIILLIVGLALFFMKRKEKEQAVEEKELL